MTNRPLLWRLYNRSREWGQRPSSLVGLDITHSSFVCWCFDEVVDHFGREVEAAISKVKSGKNTKVTQGRKENELRRMLGLERKYSSPVGAMSESDKDRPEPNFKME